VRVTYYGQACTLIEVAGRRILTDPWLTEGAYFSTWFHTPLLSDVQVSTATLAGEKIDYVFLSHEHPDHLDPATLQQLAGDVPIIICRFRTRRFRQHLERLGFPNIRELESGQATDLGDGLKVTVFRTAEYVNDSALLVEGEGLHVFNETDCKLPYESLERIAAAGIDIGFYMFSGAIWFPMMYDYPDEVMRDRVRRRRATLLKSFVQRVKLTRPRFAVPSSGPCMVLDAEKLWLNDPDMGIFIDPREAVSATAAANLPARALPMTAGDVWDSATGFERRSPNAIEMDRGQYIEDAARRMAPTIQQWRASEAPAAHDLSERLEEYFGTRVSALSESVRRRIGAKLAIVVSGPQGGAWTVDFNGPGPTFVRQGLAADWSYKIDVEDKIIYPFVSGTMDFLEDLFLSFRVRLARRPDRYNDPLYNFIYDPDPRRLENWYDSVPSTG
jgi:UDP-MurNAc hydroxylase